MLSVQQEGNAYDYFFEFYNTKYLSVFHKFWQDQEKVDRPSVLR